MTARRWSGLAALLLLFGVTSCGESSSSCTDLSGAWTLEQHCSPTLVGTSVSLVAAGECAYVTEGTFGGYAITVAVNGAVSVSGATAGTNVTCSGTATSTRIDVDCNPTCKVVVGR